MTIFFWTNTVWYISLAVISAAVLTIVFVKSQNRRFTLAFWIAVLGFTYVLEVSLLLLFDAYTYYPMIKPDDPFFDAVLGNIFSQVSVSSSAVLICVLGLSKRWLAGFSVAYFLIDLLFTHLGIYEHYWYRSVYTLVGFFIYGMIVRYWYNCLLVRPAKWLHYPTQFLGAWAVSANLAGTLLKLIGIRIFQSAIMADPSKSHTVTALIYGPLLAVIMIAVHQWRASWWQKAFVLLLMLVCQWGLLDAGVMVVWPGWGLPVLLFDLVVFYYWTATLDRFFRAVPAVCVKNTLFTHNNNR